MTSIPCPLCDHSTVAHYHTDKKRDYLQCQRCELVFVPPAFHLSSENEKAEYDKHDNQLDDPGYLKFLSRIAKPIISQTVGPEYSDTFGSGQVSNFASKASQIQLLDFGCGPGPALASEFDRLGFEVSLYDIYYQNDATVLDKQYDVVVSTEVVEHFNSPKASIEQLVKLVKPGGLLAIMTKLVINPERFSQWHYKNDPTHISFFSQATFEYLANQYQLNVSFVGNDVILLNKAK